MLGNKNGTAHKGRVLSEEHKANMRAAWTPEKKVAHGIVMSGPNNPNWKGGQQIYRGPDWPGQCGLALERDNHTCQMFGCGLTKKVLGKEPSVHHKTPYRISQNNSLDNLVTLCLACHPWQEAQ